MIDFLKSIDQSILLFINGLHHPVLDQVMWIISARITWIPLYVLFLYFGWKYLPKKFLLFYVFFAILAVAFSDLVSVHAFKNVFERYRPSHHTTLTHLLHFYEIKPEEFYKGGQYGFISSHAANFFSLAIFVGLSLKPALPKFLYLLIGIGILVSISRVYLGVHYPSDVVVGAIVGSLIGYLFFELYRRLTIVKSRN